MIFINGSKKNNKANQNNESISGRNFIKQRYDDLYIKTSNNYNSPIRIFSPKNLVSNSDSKIYGKNIIKNTNNPVFLITQCNTDVEDEGDTTSLIDREVFLFFFQEIKKNIMNI